MNITLTPIRFLERALTVFPRRTAVVCGGQRWSYAQFGQRVERLSDALVGLGIKPGDRVAFLGYNCHRLLECYFGVPQIGAVLLPLNIRLSPEDLEYIFQDAQPAALLVHPNLVDKVASFVENSSAAGRVFLLEEDENAPAWCGATYDELLEQSAPRPPAEPFTFPFEEDDPAELFYTSGTTGPPKGVLLTHRNLYLHALTAMASMPIYETDVQLHLIPLFHVNGWGVPHYLVGKGGCHVMQKQFDAEGVLRLVQEESVTRFYIVPTMLTAILELPNLGEYDLSSLRDVLIGGAPAPTGMFPRAEEALDCTVHGGFGMSETCPLIALPELPPDLDQETLRHRCHETWGFPLCGVTFKVSGPQGEALPWDGESVGELLVRGDMVMKGYLNKPEDTAESMEGGWYHTGDLVAMGEDGSLYIKDRLKEIIISGGENISSLEIEKVLYSHPDILECAVIGKKDDRWGEVPKAVVMLKPGASLTAKDIVDFTRDNMAHFKALREAEVVQDLPRGGTGKILKQQIKKLYG
ncbi:MAG: long-chain-fatty-acid--CoA ligase [Desulfarculaceae bacterium]|nr:long-chain-fatty-acid--CoA ligase [Desulfarculaceae bacterium]